MAGGWWSRIRSWLFPVLWFLLAITTFTLVLVLAIIAVIATLVPGLGPMLFPELVTAGTSLALTYFAAVTIREGRRRSRSDLVFKKLEHLYSPLYHIVEESEGRIFSPFEVPVRATTLSDILTFWDDGVVSLMGKALHLATPELVEVYWRVKRSAERSEALAKEFSDRVRSDYNHLMRELPKMDTKD